MAKKTTKKVAKKKAAKKVAKKKATKKATKKVTKKTTSSRRGALPSKEDSGLNVTKNSDIDVMSVTSLHILTGKGKETIRQRIAILPPSYMGNGVNPARYYDPKKRVEMLLETGCKKISPKMINGVVAEGIEGSLVSTHGGVKHDMTRFWVNVVTELPVLIEIERITNDGKRQINTTVYKFQWNVELGQSVFEPNIPADYSLK